MVEPSRGLFLAEVAGEQNGQNREGKKIGLNDRVKK